MLHDSWQEEEEEDALHARIVQAVVTGMNQLLPPEFRMSPNGVLWWTSSPGWPRGGCHRTSPLLDDAGRAEVGQVVFAVENMLAGLQDDVTVALTVPWPHVEGAGPSYFAGSKAEWSDGKLRFWFAAEGAPVTPVVEVPLVL